jgi:hypothetical protein
MLYDSTKVYMHVGTALRSSEMAQIGLLRVARLIADAEDVKDLQDRALLERLNNILRDIDDFEKVLVKFKTGESQKISRICSAALEATRNAMGWFQKFLENHSEEDASGYKPTAARLQAVVNELVDIRKQKVEATAAMEDAYRDKLQSPQRKANATRPVTRKNQPYPADASPAGAISADLALQAISEITQKEQDSKLRKEE